MPDDLTDDERIIWLTVYAARIERCQWEHPSGDPLRQHELAELNACLIIDARRLAREDDE